MNNPRWRSYCLGTNILCNSFLIELGVFHNHAAIGLLWPTQCSSLAIAGKKKLSIESYPVLCFLPIHNAKQGYIRYKGSVKSHLSRHLHRTAHAAPAVGTFCSTLVGCMPDRTIRSPELSRVTSPLASCCDLFQISTSQPPRMTPTLIVERRLCAALLCM